MCTLTIFPSATDIIITMNRDEQRSREELGSLFKHEHGYFPLDLQSNGTWMGANHYGFVFALLNRYQDKHVFEPNSADLKSRGGLIPQLLSCQTMHDVHRAFHMFSFDYYNPFDMVAVSPEDAVLIQWDSVNLGIHSIDMREPFFLTSSSERFSEVIEYRSKIFNDYVDGVLFNGYKDVADSKAVLTHLHMTYDSNDLSSSILMQRQLVHTKSITQMVLSDDQTDIAYWPALISNLDNPYRESKACCVPHRQKPLSRPDENRAA